MQWNDMYLAGTGAFLPKMVLVEDAIAAGRYDEHSAAYTDHLSVTVAADEDNVADMAVAAGRQALARAGYQPADVAAVFYSVVYHAGIDVWNAAAYIQQGVAAPNCFSAEVRAGSNGGLMAVEVAAAWLTAHPDAAVAVSTAGDLWAEPFFDRWRADRILYGDGAAAVAVSRRGGFAQILSLVTKTDPSLEAVHRGNQPWGPFNYTAEHPIDLIERHDAYVDTVDRKWLWDKLQAGAREAAEQALAEAGLSLGGIDHIVVPHFGRDLITRQCLEPLGGAELDRTTWEFARQVGHLGPGDQFAGLNHLSEAGLLKPGQFVLIYGVGGGFTWSCAVLQVLNDQPWAITAL
ncbi:MAG TPA: ketoacyl-ACP synthase III family protein [Pseudonocardiaceae bacterium]|jgi:3-oxoacyl-[acyl-carrier-protein] synthase-3|nr:ketoacyl-ACP synthase III family protein [Pseudonocardiaceae bacterium]